MDACIPADRWWRTRSPAPRRRRQQQRCSPLQISVRSRSPGGLSPPPLIQGPAATSLRTMDWWVRRSRCGGQEASSRHGAPAGTTLSLARALPCQTERHTHCPCPCSAARPIELRSSQMVSASSARERDVFIGSRVGIGQRLTTWGSKRSEQWEMCVWKRGTLHWAG